MEVRNPFGTFPTGSQEFGGMLKWAMTADRITKQNHVALISVCAAGENCIPLWLSGPGWLKRTGAPGLGLDPGPRTGLGAGSGPGTQSCHGTNPMAEAVATGIGDEWKSQGQKYKSLVLKEHSGAHGTLSCRRTWGGCAGWVSHAVGSRGTSLP